MSLPSSAAYQLPERYVLWCGTLEPRKNVPTLLEAFAIVRRTDPDLGLVLVGPTGWGDVPVPAHMARGVRLLGFLPTDQLHAAYAGARAFCYPSLREGFGLPVLEAMAHGVPVVTSRGTAMAEFVGDGGLLVDPLDAHAIAAALETVLGSRHDELAAAAREAVDAVFVGRRRCTHCRGVSSGGGHDADRRPQSAVAGAGSRRRQRGIRDRPARATH